MSTPARTEQRAQILGWGDSYSVPLIMSHFTKPISVSFIFFSGCKHLFLVAGVAGLSPCVEGPIKVTLQDKKEKEGDVFPALLLDQSGIESCQGDALSGSRMLLMNFPLLCGIIPWGEEFLSTSEDALVG